MRLTARVSAPRVAGTAEGMAGRAEPQSGDLHVRLEAVPDSVPEARLRVRTWCERAQVGGQVQSDLMLAVTEAATNVVQHAYSGGRPGTFLLDVHRDAGDVVVSIRDEGVGPRRAAPSAGAGLGLEIIGRMFPGFTICEADPGTRVTIRTPAS
jgi:serine/threonine-protein kinase RsbW